jgi:hypothetical protein
MRHVPSRRWETALAAAEPLAQNADEHENHKYDEYGP